MKNIHLWDPATGAGIDLDILRQAATALVTYAVNGDAGRNIGDTVFNEITEGRAGGKGYSSCGDLCHWMMKCLGCRDESIVNRNDDGGKVPWVSGANLSRIVYHTGAAWTPSHQGVFASPGDIIYLALPPDPMKEHVLVVLSHDANQLISCDYGQFFNGKAGGKKRIRKVSMIGSAMYADDRKIMGWVNITKIPLTTTASVPDDFVGGVPVVEDGLLATEEDNSPANDESCTPR